MVLAGMPDAPTYYPVLKKVNKDGPALLAELEPGAGLLPAEVEAAQEAGAVVIDTRPPEAFGAGHIPGALFAGLGPNFTAWMGWLAPYEWPLVLVLETDDRYEEARRELRRIGLDKVAGYLKGGMAAWDVARRPAVQLPQMTVTEFNARLFGGEDGLTALDVRTDDEWAMGHIDGARHLFAGEIAQGADAPLEGAHELALICGSGYRSSVAGSVLQARGRRNLSNVTGGMSAWMAADLPMSR